ncbi:PspE Rhodanese-related sulfurtransferase [Candidatus Nanopelagicaceae bacterium]|jgi:rhodanese-related sulfurtransferase
MKKLLALMAGLLLLAGCSSSAAGVTNMNVSEFSKKIAEAGVVTVDVRTPGEFMTGHIQGAQNIDFESGNFENEISTLDKNGTYAVYCRSGNRSGQAVAIMHDAGFHNVYNLNGGIIDWTNSGMMLVNN